MTCELSREVLHRYADGEFEEGRANARNDFEWPASLRGHIPGCEECLEELGFLRELARVLNGLPQEEVPRELIERLRAIADRRSAWEIFQLTAGTIRRAALKGFAIESGSEEMLRSALPAWVKRWVLFV